MRARVVLFLAVGIALAGALLWWLGQDGGPRPPLARGRGASHLSRGRLPAGGGAPSDWGPHRIAGRVTFQGEPYAGATVRLISDDAAPPVITRTDGRFDFGRLAADHYTISAQADGLGPGVESFDLRLPSPGFFPDAIDLALRPCDAAFHGRVTDISGTPLAEACVRLWSGPSVKSRSDGTYEICATPGDSMLIASAEGYCDSRADHSSLGGRVRQDFSLVRGNAIVGRVETANGGAPVAEARVQLRGDVSATTDASGLFRMTGVPPGRHEVVAVAEGYASDRATEVLVLPGHASPEVVLRVSRTYSISGTVLNDGKPIRGAAVGSRSKTPWGEYVHAFSAADGTFVLSGLPSGDMTLTVYPYTVVKPRTLRVEGADVEGVVVEVDDSAILRGRVLLGSAPAAKAIVWADGGTAGTAWTDYEGRFEMRDLPAGAYRVHAHSDDKAAHSRDVLLTLADREVREGLMLDLEAGVTVSGVVVDGRGSPLVDVRVELQGKQFIDRAAAGTGPDGAFRIRGARSGVDYRVDVWPATDGSHPLQPPGGGRLPPIRVPHGARELDGIRLVVSGELRAIAGRIVDARGAPVPHVRVEARRKRDDFRWDEATAMTAADGAFRFERLAAGEYGLTAEAPAGERGHASGVAAGRQDIVITLEGVGEIEGTLVGFGAPPTVFVGDRAADVSGTKFRIANLPAGEHRVIARGPAEADSATVDVRAGTIAKVMLTSRGTASIRGRVLEFPSGVPIPGLTCHAAPQRGFRSEDFGTGSATDANGRFELPAVPAGAVSVMCTSFASMAHAPARADRTLAPGETATIELRTARSAEHNNTIGASATVRGLDLILESVEAGGPADRAGLRVGDLPLSIDGLAAAGLSGSGFLAYVDSRPAGSVVRLTVRRDAQQLPFDVTVAERAD